MLITSLNISNSICLYVIKYNDCFLYMINKTYICIYKVIFLVDENAYLDIFSCTLSNFWKGVAQASTFKKQRFGSWEMSCARAGRCVPPTNLNSMASRSSLPSLAPQTAVSPPEWRHRLSSGRAPSHCGGQALLLSGTLYLSHPFTLQLGVTRYKLQSRRWTRVLLEESDHIFNIWLGP